MKIPFRLSLLGALLALGSSVNADTQSNLELPKIVAARWELTNVYVNSPEISITEKAPVRLARAVPVKRWKINGVVVKDRLRSDIPRDTVFVETQFGARVICEPGRRPKQDTFACLADSDGDGLYDQLGSIEHYKAGLYQSTTIGFLVGPSLIKFWEVIPTPVSASLTDALPDNDIMDINLKRNPYCYHSGCERIEICATRIEGKNIWGGAIKSEFCRDALNVRTPSVGQKFDLFVTTQATITYLGKDRVDLSLEGLIPGAVVN